MLLSTGADPNTLLNDRTVLDWAIDMRKRKIIWLLLGNKWCEKLTSVTIKNAPEKIRTTLSLLGFTVA